MPRVFFALYLRLFFARRVILCPMNLPTLDLAFHVLSSQEYFNRSTRVLEEADSNFAPAPGMMTVAQQVVHAAQTLDWFVEGVSSPEGFDLDFEKHAREAATVTSLADARGMLDAAFARSVDFVRSLDAEALSRLLPPGPIMGGQPVIDVVFALIEHTAHHRGALTVYSRLLGKVAPMPYGG